MSRKQLLVFLAAATGLFGVSTIQSAEPSFGRDIQPILARNCFACHGPDEGQRQAELRLDLREAAIEHGALQPGKPEESELLRRILSTDPDEQMPPPESNAKVTDAQKELLRAWIAAGADYEPHWAFRAPERPQLPPVDEAVVAEIGDNPIDRFTVARLQKEGLRLSPPADRYSLIRRVYLDLIGLPPTPEEADAFVRDESPEAYAKVVDQLLLSPHYGERWARIWLDLARYSDTNGYEKDRARSIWPYRDWVINALNSDMPYDEFTVEQLAGDMLPNATKDQLVATGFHRNTMLNEEGGIDPLEFRYYAMVDRVATTGTVWLGMTTGCAQCHSHKYDPISHAEYYRLMALLNNADEPDLFVPDDAIAQKRAKLLAEIEQREAQLPDEFPAAQGEGSEAERRQQNYDHQLADWITAEREQAVDWHALRPSEMTSNLPRLELLADKSVLSTGDITKRDVFTLWFDLHGAEPITALRLEALPDDRLPARGPGRCYYEGRQGDFFLSEVTAQHDDKEVQFKDGSTSYGKISIGNGKADASNVFDHDGSTGWSTSGREGEEHHLVLNLAEPMPASGRLKVELLFERHFAASLGRFRISATTDSGGVRATQLPTSLEQILVQPTDRWSAEERATVERQFALIAPELADARKPIDALRSKLPQFPTSMILEERPTDNPRHTYRHHRGEYLSPREEVSGGVPAFLSAMTRHPPTDRLKFARWLASAENPLAARVEVNRAWRALFGHGIVESTGDFGTQSEPPSHPELLDWLACEFMEQGWSRKQLHRLIVTSATYQQSSAVSAKLLARDPDNRLLSRGPGYRVDAEMVRDILLSVSGLLNPKVGGPSVYPPQPASVTALAYGNSKWTPSTGADRYRRSLYTFSKRTAPFAAYATFDAPSGETCTSRRDRSNTPLQALTLLNDEMFLEFVRNLARVVCDTIDEHDHPEPRATALFRRLLTRPPTESELAAMVDFYRAQRDRIAAGEIAPQSITGVAESSPQLAAWTMTARALANLDEVIVKP
ncbi:MAG: DUF1553 domain-containing protein [Planctomycetaceae bacterium]